MKNYELHSNKKQLQLEENVSCLQQQLQLDMTGKQTRHWQHGDHVLDKTDLVSGTTDARLVISMVKSITMAKMDITH